MKTTNGQKIFAVFNYLIISVVVLITLYPFWHIVMGSFSEPMKLMAHVGLILKRSASVLTHIRLCSEMILLYEAL